MKDSYPWYVPFINAILELDRTRVAQRVEFARGAIDERFDDLESRGELLSSDERVAIDGALSELRVLEREVKYRRVEVEKSCALVNSFLFVAQIENMLPWQPESAASRESMLPTAKRRALVWGE